MKAVIAALAANLGIAIAKFAAFFLTGSASMLAEAIHSVADTGNEVLLLIGGGRSQRARTAEHPFGFGRERYFYAFVVAVMLFTVGAAFSLYDGIHKIISPGQLDNPVIAYAVLGLSAVLEGFSLRTGIRESNEVRGGRNWGQFVHLTKIPELPVVLLEDSAALLGLLFAFLGILLSQLTGHEQWDGVGSVGIGLLLGCAAFIVGYETKSLLIGESASEEVTARIVAAVESGPEQYRLIHLRTSHIGPESLLVAGKIGVAAELTAADLAAGIDATETADPGGGADRGDDLPGAGHLPSGPGRPDRPVDRRGAAHQPPPAAAPPQAHGLTLDGSAVSLSSRWSGQRSETARVSRAEGAQGALLLEVERAARARARRDMAGAAAQVSDGGAGGRVGQHAQPERQRGRGDVVLLLDPQRRGDRGHVLVGELPVRLAAPGGPVPQRRQQPQFLPVAEHPGGHAEPRGGFRDPHDAST